MIAAEELVRGQRRFSGRTTAAGSRRARVAGRKLRIGLPALFLVGLVLFGLTAFGLTSRALGAVREGYRIDSLQAQLVQLQREREALELQVAQAQDLTRVRAVATTKLKMKEPETFRFASVTTADTTDAYAFRTDLGGGSQVSMASVDKGPSQAQSGLVVAQASAQPGGFAGVRSGLAVGEKTVADAFHRVLHWLTTVREANAGSWE